MFIYARRTVVAEPVHVYKSVHVHIIDVDHRGNLDRVMLFQRYYSGEWGAICDKSFPSEMPHETAYRRVKEVTSFDPKFVIDTKRKMQFNSGQTCVSVSVFAAPSWGLDFPILRRESSAYRFVSPEDAINQIDVEEQRISYRWAQRAMEAFGVAARRIVHGPPSQIMYYPQYYQQVFIETSRLLG